MKQTQKTIPVVRSRFLKALREFRCPIAIDFQGEFGARLLFLPLRVSSNGITQEKQDNSKLNKLQG